MTRIHIKKTRKHPLIDYFSYYSQEKSKFYYNKPYSSFVQLLLITDNLSDIQRTLVNHDTLLKEKKNIS